MQGGGHPASDSEAGVTSLGCRVRSADTACVSLQNIVDMRTESNGLTLYTV